MFLKLSALGLYLPCLALASTPTPSSTTASTSPATESLRSETVISSPVPGKTLKDHLGITYFSFFNGPGLQSDRRSYTPNQLGRPDDDGISFFNLVSLRAKVDPRFAIDFQTRFETFVNNGTSSATFNRVRWESPRIGISGLLLSGSDWTLSGALNTDFPHFLPDPLTGFTSRSRQVLLNPGTFATLRYTPRGSDWSLFSVVSPRYFFYSDREAAEPQLSRGGMSPGNKAELAVSLSPTINRRLRDNLSLTFGTTIDYRKQVLSAWNPFNASLRANGASPAWRLMAVPATLGVSWAQSERLNIYPFIQAFPIAAQRIDARTGKMASLAETASIGVWLNGVIL